MIEYEKYLFALLALIAIVVLSIRDEQIERDILKLLDDGLERSVSMIQLGLRERYRRRVGRPHIASILNALVKSCQVEKVYSVDHGGLVHVRYQITALTRLRRRHSRRFWA